MSSPLAHILRYVRNKCPGISSLLTTMAASNCPDHEVIITKRDDIVDSIMSCVYAEDHLRLRVFNATGTLNFTALTRTQLITVADSPLWKYWHSLC